MFILEGFLGENNISAAAPGPFTCQTRPTLLYKRDFLIFWDYTKYTVKTENFNLYIIIYTVVEQNLNERYEVRVRLEKILLYPYIVTKLFLYTVSQDVRADVRR